MFHEESGGAWHEVSVRKIYLTTDNATPTTLQTTRRKLTGQPVNTISDVTVIDAHGQSTRTVETVNRATATVTRTTTVPGATNAVVEITTNGKRHAGPRMKRVAA